MRPRCGVTFPIPTIGENTIAALFAILCKHDSNVVKMAEFISFMYSREERAAERGECASIAVAAFCRIVLWFEKKAVAASPAGWTDVASLYLGTIQLFGLRVGGDYPVRPSTSTSSVLRCVSFSHA